MAHADDLITSPQAAQILGVSARTIHRRVKDGTLAPVAHVAAGANGTFLFRREAIEQLAEQKRTAAVPA